MTPAGYPAGVFLLGCLVAAAAQHHDNQNDPNAAVVTAEVTKTHYFHLACRAGRTPGVILLYRMQRQPVRFLLMVRSLKRSHGMVRSAC
jgi:hypothetical protein